MYWRKGSNGYFRDVPKNEKYSGGTVIEPNLRIKDVKPQDVLEYTCIVSNGFGKSQVAMKVELGGNSCYIILFDLFYKLYKTINTFSLFQRQKFNGYIIAVSFIY